MKLLITARRIKINSSTDVALSFEAKVERSEFNDANEQGNPLAQVIGGRVNSAGSYLS